MFGASSALIAALALPASFAYAESVPVADNQGAPSELNVSKPQDNEGIEKDKKATHHKENAAGSSELVADSAEKNTIETKDFKNPDLEILPDNLGSKKLNNPNLLSNTFDEGKSLDKDSAKPYSVFDEKKPWKWNPCAEGDEGATYFESPVGKSFGIYNVLVKAEFPDKTFWHMKAAAKVDARYNMGVVQDIKVTPGSELVLTPSWISNGNKNGVDQLQVFIYDAKDFDLRKVEWERNKLKPIFAYTTTHEAAGKQGLVWKVPEKVNRIFVRFNEANRSADHTGLENKSMVALSGFTGAHVTSGSHLLLETSDKNDIRKQIWNKLFNYEFNLINYGYAPVAKGVFTAKLPEGMTVEKIKFILGDKEVLAPLKMEQ